MKKILLIFTLVITGFITKAQDYFSDRNNTGTPIFLSKGRDSTYLFSAGINVSDASSLKVNFYKQTWGKNKTFIDISNADTLDRDNSFGWGLFTNAATKNNIGKLLSSGNFDPGFTGGGYIAFVTYNTATVPKLGNVPKHFRSSYHAWIISANIGFATNQIYDPSLAFSEQLITKNMVSPSASLSYIYRPSLADGNIYFGASITYKKMSNYDALDTYTITNDSLTTGSGITRKVTKINDNGDTYAVGKYQEYADFKIRGNASFIPGSLKNRFGIILYPSIEIGGQYSARYNVGVSFNYLKDGAPTVSVFGINMEFNDLTNEVGSKKGFLKRSFRIGVTTNLNVINGLK